MLRLLVTDDTTDLINRDKNKLGWAIPADVCARERERVLPVIVIIQRIISNLNSKDKVDIMILNF